VSDRAAAAARAFSGFGALACGMAVALGAYASHVAEAQDGKRLALAALFAFGHGLALIALASRDSRLAWSARACLALGIVLFSGSLAAAVFFAAPTALAPFGGSLLMLGWGILAVDFFRTH
jgi:uncharacterized membrane protein YgdD (TMEM256/DUF423 family)